jgi:hypothetical protein
MGERQRFSAAGLPAGLACDPDTGGISGVPEGPGISSATVTGRGYYVADERFPPGTAVTISDFAEGDWHVCRDWPEHVPEICRAPLVHIAGTGADGVVGEAWVQASRLAAR